ncbi:DUF2905 family protein [Limisalsivibrio acetivorans]|uniref:DUF2905 family protein n=1 Tax=Limisalsivibrio acetivorans TaxID=1304888 RepID=UPI00047AD794
MEDMGRLLIIFGAVIALVGFVFIFGSKFGLGRLPGDISIEKENFSFHFPVVTSIIISIVVTVILNIFFRK